MNTTKTTLTFDSDLQAVKNRLWHRAGRCGISATCVVEGLWASYLLDAFEHCSRVLRLADRYSTRRLEAACRRALYYGQANYRTIRRILHRGADKLPLEVGTDIWGHQWH